MNQIFETIIRTYLEDGVGRSSEFIPRTLGSELKNILVQYLSMNHFIEAGIGLHQDYQKDANVRRDRIQWLEQDSQNNFEKEFFLLIDSFMLYLNQTCYAGITNYEFHYTLYEKGSFYRKHLDQFSENSSRVFSMIMYLNEDWKEGDGGELVVYQESNERIIEPKIGTMIFFNSAKLFHEVLETNVPRMSITGWLRRD